MASTEGPACRNGPTPLEEEEEVREIGLTKEWEVSAAAVLSTFSRKKRRGGGGWNFCSFPVSISSTHGHASPPLWQMISPPCLRAYFSRRFWLTCGDEETLSTLFFSGGKKRRSDWSGEHHGRRQGSLVRAIFQGGGEGTRGRDASLALLSHTLRVICRFFKKKLAIRIRRIHSLALLKTLLDFFLCGPGNPGGRPPKEAEEGGLIAAGRFFFWSSLSSLLPFSPCTTTRICPPLWRCVKSNQWRRRRRRKKEVQSNPIKWKFFHLNP